MATEDLWTGDYWTEIRYKLHFGSVLWPFAAPLTGSETPVMLAPPRHFHTRRRPCSSGKLANDCRREREVVCKHDYGRNLLIKKALAACRALFFFPLKIAGTKEGEKVVRVSLQIYEERGREVGLQCAGRTKKESQKGEGG